MGLWGGGGLKSLFNVGALIGQDIVARSISLTQAAGSAAVTVVQGAYVALNAGAAMRILYDGTSMKFVLSNADYLTINNATGQVSVLQGNFAVASKYINSNAGDSTGTPGNAVLNTATGRSAIAAAAAAVTITNSFVTATSIVFVAQQTADATLTFFKSIVPGAGSFTVTANAAATGNVNIGWMVIN